MATETVRVRNEELNEMRRKSEAARRKRDQAAKDLDLARQRLDSSVREMQERSKPDSKELRRAVKEEERRVLRELDGISTDLRRELTEQNSILRKELDDIRRSISNTEHEIDRVNDRISQVSEQFNERIRNFTERLRGEKERSLAYRNELQELLNDIKQLHPELLTPGQADIIEEALNFINVDIKNEDFQAAIGLAQDNLPTAVVLLGTLERLNDEFNTLSVTIAEAIVRVRERISALVDYTANSHDCHLQIGNDNFDFYYDGDIEHWSSGLFYRLCDSFDALENRINDEYISNMEMDNLRVADVDVPDYIRRFERCVLFAEEEFNISCRVQGTATRINNSLTSDDSWMVDNSGFVNEDDRLSYIINYYDGQGDQSVIVVLPVLGKSPRNNNCEAQFSVGTLNAGNTRNPALCEILRKAICGRLAHSGMDVERLNRDSRNATSGDIEAFSHAICNTGDEIKDERVRTVRTQIKL